MSIENISDIAQILVVIAVWWQVRLLNKQLKAYHKRSRIEKAVELIHQWSTNVKEGNAIAREIVENLNKEQTRSVQNQKSVLIDLKFKNSVATLLNIEEEKLKIENSKIKLTDGQSEKLRWHTVAFLNSLEVVLIAWQYSIADKGIIEKQFSFLFSSKDGHEALKNFREALGTEAFPAIEAFSQDIEDKKKKSIVRTDNIVQ